MAQEHTGANAPNMTSAEMQKWIQEHEYALRKYEAAMDPLKQLRDITKSGVLSKVKSLTKENIVQYLQNPVQNEKNLINASWYLLYRNQIYQRIILYYSTLFCLDARSVIPRYDLVKPDSDDKIMKSYNDTLKMMSNWNINNEFLKVIITCMVQDVSYNCAYYDESGLYFLPLPTDRCKIFGQYPEGDFAVAFDMSYFRGTNAWLLDAWGEPFISMQREYESSGNKWIQIPPQYSACFKKNNFDWQTIIPPFSGVLGDLINLNDITDIQRVADASEIYKLIYLKLQTVTGAKMPDEWRVDPGVAVEYFDRLINEALPDYISAAIVPSDADLGVIDFSNIDKSSETTKVLKAAKTVLNASGGAQILNSAEITGTTAFSAAIKADTEYAIAELLPQFQGWFNRALPYVVTNPSKVVFYHTGRLIRDEFRKELLEDAQYSLPTKLAVMSITGIDPLDTLSLNHLEEDILKLGDKFNDPLKSSYTSSGNNEGGRPVSDDRDLTDDGETSRDKSDNKS